MGGDGGAQFLDRVRQFLLGQCNVGARDVAGDFDHAAARDAEAVERLRVGGGEGGGDLRSLSLCVLHVALHRVGPRAGVVPDCGGEVKRGVGRRLLQHVVPFAEAKLRVEQGRHERLDARYVARHLRLDAVDDVTRVFQRGRGAAIVRGRGPDEVQIVHVVHRRIHAAVVRGVEVVFVRLRRLLVPHDTVIVAADAVVDVGRHVHEMAGARQHRAEGVGVFFGAAGIVAGLDGMDVEMDCARMVRRTLQDRFDRGDERFKARFRRALVGLPIVPRRGVHQRFCVERLGVEVVRVLLRDLLHRLCERFVQAGAIFGRMLGVACAQRVDVGALGFVCVRAHAFRRLQRGPSGRHGVRHHRHVDVRAVGERDAPPTHGAVRVALQRLLERADRGGVVEVEEVAVALIEVGLRFRGRRRDLVFMRPQIVEQRHLRRRLRRAAVVGMHVGLFVLHAGGERQGQGQDEGGAR